MASVEIAVGIVVASFLILLTDAMAALTLLSLRNEVHSPQPSARQTEELAAGGPR